MGREELLKAALALALCFVCAHAAAALAAEDLIVGSVRDIDGRPVAGALVRATGRNGAEAGRDRTDARGTFAIRLAGAVTALEVRCTHCRAERVPATPGANVIVIVTRFAALESSGLDANDLAVLPYGRAADALGLVPLVLSAGDGAAVSDRGLGGGQALVTDDGAALADLATGSSALIDFPNRSTRAVTVTRADEAFRYGPYAAGGVFALDTLDTRDAEPSAALDTGPASAVVLSPALGTLHPAYSVSSDTGVLARRADVDLLTQFAGGGLRAGATNGSARFERGSVPLARELESARVAYGTASRRYRTFIDLAASRAAVSGDGGAQSSYASSYGDGGFRVEHPGTLTLAAGIRATQQSASYDQYAPYLQPSSSLEGRARSLTTYLEAHAGDARTRVDAGLSSASIFTQTTLQGAPIATTQRALLPMLGLRSGTAGGLFARAGFSESLRLPTLVQAAARTLGPPPLQLERGQLIDAALGFDAGGRVKGEAVVYRELTRGSADRRLEGVGASVVWQVAPLVALRLWSLRANLLDTFASPYAQTPGQSRQVFWATFDRRDHLRMDLIVRRDIGSDNRAAIALDGDILVPTGPHAAFNATTARRNGVRRFSVGLRSR